MPLSISNKLQEALDTGSQVVLQTNCEPYDRYRGQILHLDSETVGLFHSGIEGGIEWHFPLEQISFIGLIREVPEALKDLGLDQGANHKTKSSPEDPPPSYSSRK